MKKLKLTLVLLFCSFHMAFAQDLQNGLLAYYPFNGNANDESGNGNDGTVFGALLTTDRFGNTNSAYQFDGTSYIRNDQFNFSINDFTVSLWLFADNVPPWYRQPFAIHSGGGGINFGDRAITMHYTANGSNLDAYYFTSDGASLGDGDGARFSPLTPGSWFHVVYRRQGNQQKLYVNGTLVDSLTDGFGTLQFQTGLLDIGAPNFWNGVWTQNGRDLAKWQGKLDDIRLYDRALTIAEIQALFGGGTSSPAGRIAFESSRDGNSEIYIMNDNGTNQINLTNNPAVDAASAISPDGTQIAFRSDRTGRAEIYKMSIDGTNVTQLTSGVTANGPNLIYGLDWHPDGSKLIFAVRRDDPELVWKIYQINADGTGFTLLTDFSVLGGPLDAQFPRFSLDGSNIYMQRAIPFNGFRSEIYVLDGGITQMTRLTFSANGSTSGASRHPAEVLENGILKVMFARDASAQGQIHIMNTDGSGVQRISNNPYNEWWPVQARGIENEILFNSNRSGDGIFNVWKMNTDGSNPVQLTTAGGTNPSWFAFPKQPSFYLVRSEKLSVFSSARWASRID